MKVSVVIPAWGETPFLERAKESVRNQADADVELIVCAPPKDGPQTALAARLAGVRRAQGEGIVFVDADDRIEPDLVASLVRAAESTVDVVCSGLIRGQRRCLPTPDIWDAGPSDVFNCLCAKLFRRSLFEGLEFDLSVEYGEDLMATARLLHRARRIVSLPKAFYHYCDNAGSVTHVLDGRRRVLDLMRVGQILRSDMPEPRFAAFHDRITRDAMLLWCRHRLMDGDLWRELRARLTTPLLADARHGWLKKAALLLAQGFSEIRV